MSTKTPILFLHVSEKDQLDAAIQLEARGYEVKTVVDVHQVLKECGHALTPRNMRWALSHVMLLCHYNVLHPAIEPADAVRTIAHVRAMGGWVMHMDALPFTAAQLTKEMADDNDLAGDTGTPVRVRKAVLRGVVAWGQRVVDHMHRLQQRADAWLGDGLKNPMVRAQRRQTYKEPGQVSTTG